MGEAHPSPVRGIRQSRGSAQNPAGTAMSLLTTPFGFHSTDREVIRGIDLSGRRAIVTGGAAGLGIETARALADAGARVLLGVRSPEAAAPVVQALQESTGNRTLSAARLDLADLHS